MKLKKTQLDKIRDEGSWCCVDCGLKYGKCGEDHLATFHKGECDVCGEKDVTVTEFRDYNFLRK